VRLLLKASLSSSLSRKLSLDDRGLDTGAYINATLIIRIFGAHERYSGCLLLRCSLFDRTSKHERGAFPNAPSGTSFKSGEVLADKVVLLNTRFF
jgi:hypothetical protein